MNTHLDEIILFLIQHSFYLIQSLRSEPHSQLNELLVHRALVGQGHVAVVSIALSISHHRIVDEFPLRVVFGIANEYFPFKPEYIKDLK